MTSNDDYDRIFEDMFNEDNDDEDIEEDYNEAIENALNEITRDIGHIESHIQSWEHTLRAVVRRFESQNLKLKQKIAKLESSDRNRRSR